MPPRLQTLLINACLFPLEEKFNHFFREMGSHQLAPRDFINRLLTNLRCYMIRVGEVIQTEGNQFDQLFFFAKGRGVLTRNFRSKYYGKFQLEVVELPEGSFYGELCILLGNTSYFNLQIGNTKSDQKDEGLVTKNGDSMAMVYSIEASAFKELCKDYPEFGTHIYTRAEIREAYFKHLAFMRCSEFSYNMKVIEIEKSMEGNVFDL